MSDLSELGARAFEVGRALAAVEYPREIVKQLGDSSLLRECVPAAFGGARVEVELGALCAIRESLAWHSSLVDTMFAMQGLGSFPVTLAGSDAQKKDLLPRVASGELITAFALTEPEAGSDVSAIATRARSDGDGWILDGQKRFISNAGVADRYVVFARSGDGKHDLSAFLVEGDAPGLTTEPIELIADHPIGIVHLHNCRIAQSSIIGEPGAGFRIAMATLDRFRASVGAAACGLGARALHEALARVKTRRQFGRALAEHQATQLALAEMSVELDAARLLVAHAARLGDAGGKVTRESATAKLYATEAAQRIVDRALQLHGGDGLVRGTTVERLYREVRALRIYEGTSEIQKLVIARELLRAT